MRPLKRLMLSRLRLMPSRKNRYNYLMTKIIGENRQMVLKLRAIDPTAKAINMAATLGITRQRVHAILLAEKLTTKFLKLSYCKICGGLSKRKYCSIECWNKSHFIEVSCQFCKMVKTVGMATYKYHQKRFHRWYCSRGCFIEGRKVGWS